MRKKSDTPSDVARARSGAVAKQRSRGAGARRMIDGSRAVPGKVSRGSFHFMQADGFSGLGRIILDKLDRGVILIDARGRVVDANTLAVLRDLYGLTPAQARVARSLFADRSVEATAAALDLSLNTVRTHLKQIFTRCEVPSQAELLHLLAQGPQRL